MEIQDFSQYLKDVQDDVRQQLEQDLPDEIGNLAVRRFKLNFQKESFFGKPWLEVKRRQNGTKGAAGSRKILTESGDLGDSIDYETHDGSVTVFSDLPYSEAHNEGTKTAGRNNNVTIPQRQFMGEHENLTQLIKKKIERAISKALKQ